MESGETIQVMTHEIIGGKRIVREDIYFVAKQPFRIIPSNESKRREKRISKTSNVINGAYESFFLMGGCSVCFVANSRIIFGFGALRHDTKSLANFKYKLRPITNSEVKALAKAAKKKAKKVAKKK